MSKIMTIPIISRIAIKNVIMNFVMMYLSSLFGNIAINSFKVLSLYV